MNHVAIQWDDCRRRDLSIDLRKAARHTGCKVTEGADRYLAFVEDLKQVTSRQIAALSIATAFALYPPTAAHDEQPKEK